MGERLGPAARGLAVALGVALPAALLANIVAGLGDLPRVASQLLALVVVVGTVAGGAAVGRADPPRAALQAALVGAVAIALLATLGYLRRRASGEDVDPVVIPALTVLGALFGTIGGAVGRPRAARTRP